MECLGGTDPLAARSMYEKNEGVQMIFEINVLINKWWLSNFRFYLLYF